MTRQPSDRCLAVQAVIEPFCMHCGAREGQNELVFTGDDESLEGFEVWFSAMHARLKPFIGFVRQTKGPDHDGFRNLGHPDTFSWPGDPLRLAHEPAANSL